MCPVVSEVAGSLNWCGSQSSLVWYVAVLNSFMMVDASPVTHKLVLFYVQNISFLLLLVAMDVVSDTTNQVQDI